MTSRSEPRREPQAGATLKYRADIDGIRAIAVTLVLVFHFSLVPQITAGFIGVDIFFVISGFLITAILLRQLEAQTFSLPSFYVNRIRRLAPPLFVVLLLVMSAGAVWLFPIQLVQLSIQALAAQFYFANFYFWQTIGYFGLAAHDVFLLHTWSLAVEEQFYLIYPVFLLLLYRHFRKYIFAIVLSGFAASFFLNVLFVHQKAEATFYLLPTRAWELLLGALVTLAASRWQRNKLTEETLGFIGIALIAIGTLCYRNDFSFPGFYALLPAVGTACLLLCGQRNPSTVSRVLSCRPLVYIGKISYSLYLVHWPVNVFAGVLIAEYSQEWRIAMFIFSIACAAVIYQLIEHPLRQRKYLATRSQLLASYSIGLAVTLTIILVVNTTHGLPKRFPDNVVRIANYVNDKTEPLTECEFLGRNPTKTSDFCQIGIENKTPTWLVYGDSHAWAAHLVFDKWLKMRGETGLFIFRHSCPPLNGIHLFGDGEQCHAFNQSVTQFIGSDRNLVSIVLVSTWQQAVEGRLSTSSEIIQTKEESIQLFDTTFKQTVENLHQWGRRVYVWEPVPGAATSVPLETARAALEHRPPKVEISLADYLATNQFFFNAVAANRQAITAMFSPYHTLCATGQCAALHNGVPLYFDNNHMTKSTWDFWIKILQSDIPPP